MPRGTAQIADFSTWLPPSLDTPGRMYFLNISITRQSEKLEFQKKKKKKRISSNDREKMLVLV